MTEEELKRYASTINALSVAVCPEGRLRILMVDCVRNEQLDITDELKPILRAALRGAYAALQRGCDENESRAARG